MSVRSKLCNLHLKTFYAVDKSENPALSYKLLMLPCPISVLVVGLKLRQRFSRKLQSSVRLGQDSVALSPVDTVRYQMAYLPVHQA